MIKVCYDRDRNTLILEFVGKIDSVRAAQFYKDVQKLLPKCHEGVKILTDLSALEEMDPDIKGAIKKAMDLFNARGVTDIIRVIPDPTKDIGFNIMSLFHYSKEVKFVTLQSREEAEARLV